MSQPHKGTTHDQIVSIQRARARELVAGDVVRYSTPSQNEADALFMVIEAHYDVPKPRARIRLLDSGMAIAPEEVLSVDELEQVACGEVQS